MVGISTFARPRVGLRRGQSSKRIDRMVVGLAVAVSVTAAAATTGVAFWGLNQLGNEAIGIKNEATIVKLESQAEGIAQLVDAGAQATQNTIDSATALVQNSITERGGFRLLPFDDEWQATNQFTRETRTVSVPRAAIGAGLASVVIEPNDSPAIPAPIVDTVGDTIGAVATIFLRMDDDSMLRITTNAITGDGNRAIGTYIPAVNPDGTPNVVVDAILRGESYSGIGFVVDSWSVTAYEPLYDLQGELVGMVGTAVSQLSLPALAEGVQSARVFESGVVAVVGAAGATEGLTVISDDFALEEPFAETAQLSDPEAFEQLAATAVSQPRAVAIGHVDNIAGLGESLITMYYYEPWEWLVLVLAPEAEVNRLSNELASRQNTVRFVVLVVALLVAAITAFGAYRFAGRIADRIRTQALTTDRSVRALSNAASTLSGNVAGTVTAANEMSGTSGEVAQRANDVAAATEELSVSFNETASSAEQVTSIAARAVAAVEQATSTIETLSQQSHEIDRVTELINSIAEQTKLLALNATIEAARAGAAGRGFAVVASEVKDLAGETERATNEISRQIDAIRQGTVSAQGGVSAIAEVMGELTEVQTALGAAIEEQQATAAEIARSVQSAATAATDIADRATGVADESSTAIAAVTEAEQVLSELAIVVAELKASVGEGKHAEATSGSQPDRSGAPSLV